MMIVEGINSLGFLSAFIIFPLQKLFYSHNIFCTKISAQSYKLFYLGIETFWKEEEQGQCDDALFASLLSECIRARLKTYICTLLAKYTQF